MSGTVREVGVAWRQPGGNLSVFQVVLGMRSVQEV